MIKVAVCVFWLAISLAAAQQPSGSSHGSESLLLALENAWNQAQLHHDSRALGELIADTFVSTDSDGVFETKAEFLADNKDPAFAPTVMVNSDVRVFLYENLAVVTGIYHAKGSYRSRPFDHYGRFTDAWAFLGGKWTYYLRRYWSKDRHRPRLPDFGFAGLIHFRSEGNRNRMNCNVADFLLEGKPANRTALWLPDRKVTYGDIKFAAEALSSHFDTVGCRKGDRVILAADNSWFWVSAYLGILRSALVCVPVPPTITAEDLAQVIAATEPKVAVVHTEVVARCWEKLNSMPAIAGNQARCPSTVTQTSWADIQMAHSSSSASRSCVVEDNDLAALMFTSGATAKPRAVMVSHGNIVANTQSIIQYLRLGQADRLMAVLPFHYCYGTSLLCTHLRVGASLVLGSRFMYPEAVLQRMIETECTGFAGVPSHYQILLRNSSLWKKNFPHLRYLQQAGGELPATFIRELMHALPRAQIFIMYGQTEATARLSYLPPEYLNSKLGSIGRGIPGVHLRVLDKSGQTVRPGEVGEIVAKGDNVTLGYWREPAQTAFTFRNGELHTGDLATVDHDGFIYIVDRARDFVKCGGKRTSCRQIENQLLQSNEIIEAAVVGIRDDRLGEAVKAFVVPLALDYGLRERLYTLCKKTLPAQLVPKDIVLLKALPKNSAGKVVKRALKSLGDPAATTTCRSGGKYVESTSQN